MIRVFDFRGGETFLVRSVRQFKSIFTSDFSAHVDPLYRAGGDKRSEIGESEL